MTDTAGMTGTHETTVTGETVVTHDGTREYWENKEKKVQAEDDARRDRVFDVTHKLEKKGSTAKDHEHNFQVAPGVVLVCACGAAKVEG